MCRAGRQKYEHSHSLTSCEFLTPSLSLEKNVALTVWLIFTGCRLWNAGSVRIRQRSTDVLTRSRRNTCCWLRTREETLNSTRTRSVTDLLSHFPTPSHICIFCIFHFPSKNQPFCILYILVFGFVTCFCCYSLVVWISRLSCCVFIVILCCFLAYTLYKWLILTTAISHYC